VSTRHLLIELGEYQVSILMQVQHQDPRIRLLALASGNGRYTAASHVTSEWALIFMNVLGHIPGPVSIGVREW
jgi:hypothetical protein